MSNEEQRDEYSSLVTGHSSLFQDPDRATSALQAIARRLPDPIQALRFAEALPEPLSRCADPDMALANLVRWASHLTSASATIATLQDDPRLLADLLCVFAASQYLADILIREPTAYTLLLEPDEAWQGEDLRVHLAALVAPFPRPESRLEALRRARRRQFLRIGWRDVTGRTTFETVVSKISELAAALIEHALATVRAPLAERQPEVDAQVRFAVVAMGKLGGRELNYSSDIDLLFIYDSPTPDDPAHLRYATKLGEALFAALNATTAEGMLFRVDMRLRPEGRFGALVRSLGSYREYYDRWMETWERQALIKARPVAGDPELGRRFAALAEERAYPTLHAATLFEDVRDMRAAIERRVESRDQSEINVKEGRGTIREIEFTVQLLQILFGARRPELRAGNTLEALAALEGAGLLTAAERVRFAEHYIFFRTVEHRLQIMDDLPVRLLPEAPEERRKLARRMGFGPEEADRFFDTYRARADEVERLSRGILDRLMTDGVAAADPLRLLIMSLAPQSGVQTLGRSDVSPRKRKTGENAKGEGKGPSRSSPADFASSLPSRFRGEKISPDAVPAEHLDLTERLAAAGFRDPAAAVERLRSLATGAPRFSLPVSTTRLFADLAGSLLEAAAAAPDPDGALDAVAAVAERLGAHRTFYQTLQSQPDMLRVLCCIVGFSPFVRELVLRSPELLDVLYDQPFREMPHPVEEMRADVAERLARAFSPNDRLAALRRFQKRELLRLIARDLLLDVDAETTARDLADLADTCVAGALSVAALQGATAAQGSGFGVQGSERSDPEICTVNPEPSLPPDPRPKGFAVIALGRLGGKDMHYLSDLDLLYVYEPPPGSDLSHRHYEALAAELNRSLKEWLRDGQLYEVDLRLRPEGKSGYIAVHLDAARRYYPGGRAQTWERQALTKARPIAGDMEVAARFQEAITPFVYGPSDRMNRIDGIDKIEAGSLQESAHPVHPVHPVNEATLDAELRSMKRRIETERVGPEERPRHLKLGPGGLSDIEFLVQRLQLRHGAASSELRVPSTYNALRAASRLSLLPEDAVRDLLDGLTFLTLLRQRLRLRSTGTPTDLLPEDPAELTILARSLHLPDGSALLDCYRATTTRVRKLFTQYFLEA